MFEISSGAESSKLREMDGEKGGNFGLLRNSVSGRISRGRIMKLPRVGRKLTLVYDLVYVSIN